TYYIIHISLWTIHEDEKESMKKKSKGAKLEFLNYEERLMVESIHLVSKGGNVGQI
ncbi:hypothetical protein KI387_036296, partial [Taxus chinensis]